MTEAEWLACNDPVAMREDLRADASDRKLRLYFCGGCRHMTHLYYRPESLAAVEVAERFADGLADEQDLARAEWDAESPTFGYDFEEHFWKQYPDPKGRAIVSRLVEMQALPQSVLSGGDWRVN